MPGNSSVPWGANDPVAEALAIAVPPNTIHRQSIAFSAHAIFFAPARNPTSRYGLTLHYEKIIYKLILMRSLMNAFALVSASLRSGRSPTFDAGARTRDVQTTPGLPSEMP